MDHPFGPPMSSGSQSSGRPTMDTARPAYHSTMTARKTSESINGSVNGSVNGDTSSEGADTPRPVRRVMSGRFPVKVDGKEVPNMRSPNLPRAPPIPNRSHYRVLSQQNAALRRPGIMPLSMGNSNERLRSNSESLLQRDNKNDRSRRMGIVSKKPNELATVDEAKTNRYSHLRGLSHGSALQSGGSRHDGRAPTSPAESVNGKTGYVRRLSSLPERKRQSESPDPVIEAAKGILFALDLVNPLIQNLMSLTRTNQSKRSSLEVVFFNAHTHVEELEHSIRDYDTYTEEDEEIAPKSNANVHSAVITAIQAYMHVCSSLSRHIPQLMKNGDPRYIRMLMWQIYNSLAEVRNAGVILQESKPTKTMESVGEAGDEQMLTLRPSQRSNRDKSQTPTRERPTLMMPPTAAPRMRSATIMHNPSNLRVMTDSRSMGKESRANTMSAATATPRTVFADSDDRLFEPIFVSLQQCTDLAIVSLATVNNIFLGAMRKCGQQGEGEAMKSHWQTLIQRCTFALQTAEQLRGRLSLLKIKEPNIRLQSAFWELINTFINAYYNLVIKVKEVKAITTLLTNEVVAILRPLQKTVRETNNAISKSPWSYILTSSNSSNQTSNTGVTANPAYGVLSPPPTIALPMTPASAALGPAVQATVPSTPSYASTMFSGNVFERADALLASASSSAFSSRAGTMTGGSFGGSGGSGFGAANGNAGNGMRKGLG